MSPNASCNGHLRKSKVNEKQLSRAGREFGPCDVRDGSRGSRKRSNNPFPGLANRTLGQQHLFAALNFTEHRPCAINTTSLGAERRGELQSALRFERTSTIALL
ncbi:hypothetical protein AVEN_123760-1 [Araneus ventricosus]|uniref:Uncharacterized protein n=1 Tax=Araneus ventricosus TaxID=182803 RepID=A0A4Y2BMU8_ARAVE|nr:hypothetical protein AVEN_123760-1 [Araneus ventricosus]